MRAALRQGWLALRAFARGFTGLAAPMPRESEAWHAHQRERAARRTPCC
ncbi:MAG TPA: hypothetical protein VNF72_07185 [Myxococcota bacterium]|jgi:hypothetical protein|nr:hypothetical protein [Myxococcota bacterium]